ncbi:MAG TPA: AAA family ATPase [Steroidobacteraceae bacterium]|nr:AAA family ATPase [Steroidobacteraceae bacterium]
MYQNSALLQPEILRADDELILARGRAGADQARVLTVTTAARNPSPSTLAQLEHAYTLRHELDNSWAARPLALAREESRLTLILEDPGGQPVDQLCSRPLPLGEFLRVAVGLAGALGGLHQKGLIHKDIKPANLLAHTSTGQVWLTGFGFASRVPREPQVPHPPHFIPGTLEYVAPEQTGRMNHSIDLRADLYSCGVTLYQMLTGQLPFSASDPMEWVHCHIARQPQHPGHRREDTPAALDAIVMKLLAKTPEERYQTAAGLEADLRLCLTAWDAHGRIDGAFVPGQYDAPDKLLVPERLYGREAETDVLTRAFERVASEGKTRLVLVSGHSGIGKSSVVQELRKRLTPARGLFAAGKFDQYKQNVPFATLAQAFRDLVRDVLGKSNDEIERHRLELLQALGPSAQLMIELIPELEFLIGTQPPLPDLSPQDAQNRLHRMFDRFIGVFARPERPLVLFLDDLQWLDAATLSLVEHLVTASSTRHLLLLGAYRDNEIAPAHPLLRTLQAMRKSAENFSEVALSPLSESDVRRLLADTFRSDEESVWTLAQVVYAKTAGNPFFTIQFLKSLPTDELVWFDASSRAWRWEIEGIHARGATANVFGLLARTLDRLPVASQELLRDFACLGNHAHMSVLGAACGLTEAEVENALVPAVRAELVSRQGERYHFMHDHIQEAAYSLTPESARPTVHLRLARSLLSWARDTRLEEHLFDIVNQFNRGVAGLSSPQERDQVAEFNVRAGKRAKASTAYASALMYFGAGRALLDENRWKSQRALSFTLELELAECEFLTGQLVTADKRLAGLGPFIGDLLERSAVTQLRVTICSAQDEQQRAMDLTLEFLRLCGIDWSSRPTRNEVMQQYAAMRQRLGDRAIETLIDLPQLTDPHWRAVLDVLAPAIPVSIYLDENLTALILCKMVDLSLQFGNCDASTFAYVLLASIFGPYFGDAAAGFRFGEVAFQMIQKPELGRHRARVASVFAHRVHPWSRPVRTSQALTRHAHDIAMETGDLTFAAYGRACLLSVLLAGGDALDEIQSEAESSLEFVTKSNFGPAIDLITVSLTLIRALRGLTPQFNSFDSGDFNEARFEQHLESSPNLSLASCWYWTRKLQGRYLAGEHAAALAAARKAAATLFTSTSFLEIAEYHFYRALANAAVYEDSPGDEQPERLQSITADCAQLDAWAAQCPENFADRAALIRAEIARIGNRELEAMKLYEDAIRRARTNGFVQNEALAHELAGRFYSRRGFDSIATAYMQNARSCYRTWGADGKVRQLEQQQPGLTTAPAAASASVGMARGRVAGTPFEHLDLATVVKSSQAVSAQSGLERLLRTLMVILLEHAGAQRGLLLLRRDDTMRIEAEAKSTQGAVKVRVKQSRPTANELPETLLQFVARTRETVILDDARAVNQFSTDTYFLENECRSILCLPLLKRAELIGILYLENSLTSHVFTPERIALLELLAGQAAMSLESASLEEKDALLKEVHHRVKNNLQLISSLLSLQTARIGDPTIADQLNDSRNRIRSVALVHENLYQAGNFSKITMASHVRSLCAHLGRAYDSPGRSPEMTIEVGELQLDMNQAIACGLIINELVSNALKHAFPQERAGHVKVSLRSAGGRKRVLEVGDDGIGLPAGLDIPSTNSLGLRLVQDLTDQLHGTLVVTGDGGTTFAISFDDAGTDEGEE